MFKIKTQLQQTICKSLVREIKNKDNSLNYRPSNSESGTDKLQESTVSADLPAAFHADDHALLLGTFIPFISCIATLFLALWIFFLSAIVWFADPLQIFILWVFPHDTHLYLPFCWIFWVSPKTQLECHFSSKVFSDQASWNYLFPSHFLFKKYI